jgi:hypothetical protein
VRGLIRHLSVNHSGRIVLVSSHRDRIPQIIEGLGSDFVPEFTDGDYDDLFVITLYRFGRPKILRLKYGRET